MLITRKQFNGRGRRREERKGDRQKRVLLQRRSKERKRQMKGEETDAEAKKGREEIKGRERKLKRRIKKEKK